MSSRPNDEIQPISMEELGRLGINRDNEIFWDGKRLVTSRRIYLTFPQKILALLTALAALATVATGFNNASVFLCARDIHWLSCPVAAGK